MRALFLAVIVTALAACSSGEPQPADEKPAAQSSPTSTGAPTGATTPPPTNAAIAEVPAQFHGIWDNATGSCDPASDMRTEIAERGITFYESHGAVTALTVHSPVSFTAELAMQGEGERWTMTRTFTLSTDDTILTSTGGGHTGEPMPLRRCA